MRNLYECNYDQLDIIADTYVRAYMTWYNRKSVCPVSKIMFTEGFQ